MQEPWNYGNKSLKVLTDDDIQKVQDTVSSWRNGDAYEDINGYCKSSTTEEIEKNGFILTPGRYVGFDDSMNQTIYADKISKLKADLSNILRDSSL